MKNKTKLMLGDNIESLKKLPANSIDSVVTDPPYGLLFMGKKWDYDVPSVDFWKEVYRVLKPGGHIVSFGGTRTYHRMVVNMEDAGFEIRDQIMWIYGSGFPKSHNIGKAVDKIEGNERESKVIVNGMQTRFLLPYNSWNSSMNNGGIKQDFNPEYEPTKGTSEWEGFGTALKPANEPICLARKPLSEKSVAENVLKWRTGGINVDGCRVEGESWGSRPNTNKPKLSSYVGGEYNSEGRFPANIIFECICDEVIKGEIKSNTRIGNYGDKGNIHTNPDCPCRLLDEQSGESKSNKGVRIIEGNENRINPSGWKETNRTSGEVKGFTDKGGASRFFYQAKVSKAERNMGLDGFECEIKLTPTIKLIVKTDYNNKNLLWEKQDLKTELVDTDKLHQKDTEEYGALLNEDKLWNTDMYGNYIMEQFQKDFKSIIEMEINSTTIYQILNSSIQKNTKTYIQELYGEMVKDINFVENVEKKSTKMTFTLQEEKTDGYTANVKSVSLKGIWNISVKENKCSHPTLKPINLMTYLCRLITPPNGIVLDPFMGSGSTGVAAQLEGFRFVGMEMDVDYFKIAEARIENFEKYTKFTKK